MSLLRVVTRRIHNRAVGFAFDKLNLKSTERNTKTKESLHDLLVSMPKDPVHVPGLKSGRAAKRDASTKFPAGYIRLEVLGNGAKGAPSSLYVFTDQTRYLFNCGEGTQRLAHEHKMKLAKLEHIFVTNSIWEHIGGIPGVALTVQDIGVPTVTLHGPPGLENLFEGTRRFVILNDLKIKIADPEVGVFEDQVMRVEFVPLVPRKIAAESAQTAEEENTAIPETQVIVDEIDYYAPIKGCKRNLDIEGHGSISKKMKVDTEGPSHHAVCYICRPKPKAGALLIQKCIDYGVPAGPLLGQLKSGKDVTLPNGSIVKAASVRSPDAPPTAFMIVDCPTEDHLDSLLNNKKLNKHQKEHLSQNDFVHVVIHFTPKEVLTNPLYISWMEKFRVSTQHIILNTLCEGMGSEAVHKAQFKLNLVDKEIFPLLKDTSRTDGKGEPFKDLQFPMFYASTNSRFNLRPTIGQDRSAEVRIDGEDFVKEVLENPEFEPSLEELKSELSDKKNQEVGSAREYPKLVFLGTGSCIPNKTRNTSSILLDISSDSTMLLDCGEGTYGQLVRFFGADVEQVLLRLNAIFVSHLHADHHLGLINLLQRRNAAFRSQNLPFYPVFLISPQQIQSWLYLYHKTFEPLSHLYKIIPTTSIYYPESSLDPAMEEKLYKATGLVKIQTVAVHHCPNAYGIAVEGNGGWKITYSGDTMPCDSLVNLGRNSDLLIHEATMEDELKDEALMKMHSTVSQAIEMGKKMNAKFTMLTHFSQRYAKVPKINGEMEKTVGIAFDNMSLRLSDLWKVPLMYPTFKTMFAEYVEDMESKTAKKLRRRERELKDSLI